MPHPDSLLCVLPPHSHPPLPHQGCAGREAGRASRAREGYANPRSRRPAPSIRSGEPHSHLVRSTSPSPPPRLSSHRLLSPPAGGRLGWPRHVGEGQGDIGRHGPIVPCLNPARVPSEARPSIRTVRPSVKRITLFAPLWRNRSRARSSALGFTERPRRHGRVGHPPPGLGPLNPTPVVLRPRHARRSGLDCGASFAHSCGCPSGAPPSR
jgi:hypothetical protein